MIFHFCSRSDWSAAQAAGVYSADTLASQGFIHCSTREQAHLPANALARGRTDLVLLTIDEDRLPTRVTWEAGDPPDPGGLLFPHVYAPIPIAAVVSVDDFQPAADGLFAPLA